MNILGFLKKKPAEEPKAEKLASEPVVEKQVQIDDIAIHTMPERFRHQPAKTSSAKTTGILIIGGGVVFLIAVSALLYFFVFKSPAVTVIEENPEITASSSAPTSEVPPEVNQNPTNPATTTPPESVVLPGESGSATSTATSTPETVEPGLTAGYIPSLDSDQDGLTNAEEILLGASTSTPDTDGDGYSDGAEILNLYDPASQSKLASNTNIALYENKTYRYSVLYPSAWQISANGGDDSIMFKTNDNQFFQVIVQPNSAKQSLDQWYMEQLSVVSINDSDRLNGPNWQGIKNIDGLTLYLMDAKQNYIFTLAYNPGENNILDYINIFNMMVKSFTLKE